MKQPTPAVRSYISQTGHKGGLKSRRRLSAQAAHDMVRVREARRAFHAFHAQCFWYMREDAPITLADVPEIVRGLRQNGGRKGFLLAEKLCR
jgi:hypothetical protein